MKKQIWINLLTILMIGGFLFMAFHVNNNKIYKENNIQQDYSQEVEDNKKENTIKEKIDSLLTEMTLEEKIGQMMIIFLYKDDDVNDKNGYETLLRIVKPGGVILTSNDFKNKTADEVIQLTTYIRSFSEIPLMVSVDQEGGRVQRLNSLKDAKEKKIYSIPNMKTIGKLNNLNVTFDIGRLMGIELSALGINMDFAPVIDTLYVDSNVIGDRSFGNDGELVSNMGIALSNGLNAQGVVSVYKHFPNHGVTSVDSHNGLPVIDKTKDQLYETDLIPFIKAIENNASVMMIGHLLYPNITDKPSSLSKEIINDLLKEELGYEGLVITDSLRMKAIIDEYSEKEVYELAINAGVDLLLMPNDPENAIKYIKESINEGIITEEQINASVRKILQLKYTSLKNEIGDIKLLDSPLYTEISENLSNVLN